MTTTMTKTAELAYPTGCHPSNWDAFPIGETHVFLSKTTNAVKYVDASGIARTFHDDDGGYGIRHLLEVAKVGSAPERVRERRDGTDPQGNSSLKETVVRISGGVWEGREAARLEAGANSRRMNEINGESNMPVARVEPYEPTDE